MIFFRVTAAFDGCLLLLKSKTSSDVANQLLYVLEATVRRNVDQLISIIDRLIRKALSIKMI